MLELVLIFAIVGFVSSTVYLGLALVGAARFRRSHSDATAAPFEPIEPVTLLKPLHGMEPRLRENLESFFQQDYPEFEIFFGVRDNRDPALNVVREIASRYPDVPVSIALAGDPKWPNAKVHNLHSMLALASFDLLVISDSDVHVAPDYLRAVTAPLADRSVGLVTCLYRGVHTGGLWPRLEALGMSVELTSGVLVANMLEGMKFALGPTMATRREPLADAGGFEGLASYLADD